MSHRKASKRRRELDGDGEFPPSFLLQTKRSKSDEDDEEVFERNESALHTLQDTDTGVRRSSRPPKPKVFDDEETAVTVEASSSSKPGNSGLIQSVDQPRPSTISKRITPKNEPSISRKQKKLTPAAIYDGHKRETRRSYQSYLEELKTETDPFKHTRNELESGELTASKKQQRSRERKVTQRNKSDATSHVVESTTPKTTGGMEKTLKGKGTSNSRTKRETPDEPSPKVRTSSRTPVPKRIFSLLEEEEKAEQKSEEPGPPGLENESVNLSSPKARSSSRPHMPKKSFPLLEKEDRMEAKQDVPEQTYSKTRTPKSQGTKRRLSTAAEGSNDQNLATRTPVTGDEPSPKVRVSSRGHKPKRTFSLLEGEESSDKSEEGSNTVSEKIYDEERFVLANQIEQQKSTMTKEPKRRKSNSGQQLSKLQPSSKKELKSSSNHGSEDLDSVVVKVERSDVGRDISAVAAASENATAVTASVSETSRSAGSKDDQVKGRLNKRKGKPVKKKVSTSQEAQMSMASVPGVKVKIEPELSTGYETVISPKTINQGSSKKKKAQSLGKNVVKQEGVENTEGFSLSDIARGVIDSSTASSDPDASVSKGKRKGKLSKDTKQKANKDKNKALDKSKKASSNSDGKTEEHEHIILKLQLPQSEDSTKHKKHHHHHHHHHHKHKHSSGSHEDGSPKKSHHKKSAAKLPDESSDSGGNKKAVVKKKKISIKFKGLLNKELEMASNDLEESSSAGLKSTEKQSDESGKKKKKPKKAISSSEEKLLPSSQSESEHVRLVIKKDKIPTDSKSEDVKTKKISKPTASSSVNQKKTTLATESKKGKGSSTPSKRTKSPQVY